MTTVIVQSEWYNAVYEEGALKDEGPPEHLDAETLARTFPLAEVYSMDEDVYFDVLDGAGYPDAFSDLPVVRLTKVR